MKGAALVFEVGTALLAGDRLTAVAALNACEPQDLTDGLLYLLGGMFSVVAERVGLGDVPLGELTVEHRARLLVEWRRAALVHAAREAAGS